MQMHPKAGEEPAEYTLPCPPHPTQPHPALWSRCTLTYRELNNSSPSTSERILETLLLTKERNRIGHYGPVGYSGIWHSDGQCGCCVEHLSLASDGQRTAGQGLGDLWPAGAIQHRQCTLWMPMPNKHRQQVAGEIIPRHGNLSQAVVSHYGWYGEGSE